MTNRNRQKDELLKFLGKTGERISAVFAFIASVDASLSILISGFQGHFINLLISGAILLPLLACFYFAFVWKPQEENTIENDSILYLPNNPREKKSNIKTTKRVKKLASAGIVIIALLLLIDLVGLVSMQKSFLWKSFYLSKLNSKPIPEFVEECSNAKHSIRIKYPQSWSCLNSENPLTKTIFVLNPEFKESSTKNKVKLIVKSYSVQSSQTLDQLLTEQLAIVEQRLDKFEPTKTYEIVFLGQRGYKVEYTA
ncbi:hypothetical protein IQ260_11220, partial [Leptolyngbya cf. ectocarpi LEGE 11479]